MPNQSTPTRIVIAGAGYGGMYTAWRLQRKLRRQLKAGTVQITLIDPASYMTYQPFLPETAAGSLEPRHVVVNLRRLLRRCEFINGSVTAISQADKQISYLSAADEKQTIDYDLLVVALGGVSRTLPIPGLADYGIGIKSVGEAAWLRNHVLSRLDVAASTSDPEIRRRMLTFVVVGGGYAGIETLAELEDLSRVAARDYPELRDERLRWVLVEATDRILPEVGPKLGKRTVAMLQERGIDMRLETRLESAADGHIVLSDGEEFDADTLVWTAGVRANPVLASSDLPLDDRGRLRGDATLQVVDAPDVWAIGDCAAIPDLTQPGKLCSPSAQHAIRQAKRLAANIVATLRGRKVVEYRHRYAGSVAGLGLHRGVAQIFGIPLRGFPAWFVHRSYHVMMMPTIGRKVRIVADWTLALFFKRDVISLGEIHEPRAEFTSAFHHSND